MVTQRVQSRGQPLVIKIIACSQMTNFMSYQSRAFVFYYYLIYCTFSRLEVRLGEWNAEEEHDCDMLQNCNDPAEDIIIENAIVHPSYVMKNRFIYADIALLRLQRAVTFTSKIFLSLKYLPCIKLKVQPFVNIFGLHVSIFFAILPPI